MTIELKNHLQLGSPNYLDLNILKEFSLPILRVLSEKELAYVEWKEVIMEMEDTIALVNLKRNGFVEGVFDIEEIGGFRVFPEGTLRITPLGRQYIEVLDLMV